MVIETKSGVIPASQREEALNRALIWSVDIIANAIVRDGQTNVIELADRLGINEEHLTSVVAHSERLVMVGDTVSLTVLEDGVNRSVDRWCSDILRSVGRPVRIETLANVIADVSDRPLPSVTMSLNRVLESPGLAVSDTGMAMLAAWLPMLGHEDVDDILAENGIKKDLADIMVRKLSKNYPITIDAAITDLLDTFSNTPLRHKTVAVAYWIMSRTTDSANQLCELLTSNQLVWLSGIKGGKWILARSVTEFQHQIAGLAPVGDDTPTAMLAMCADAGVPVAPLLAVVEPKVLGVSDDDVRHFISGVIASREPVSLHTVCDSQDLELLSIWTEKLAHNSQLAPIGWHRYVASRSLPVFDIERLRLPFEFPVVEFISEDGEQVEDVISVESLAGSLKMDILSPEVQDILDDALNVTDATHSIDQLTFPIFEWHVAAGVLPLCRFPTANVPVGIPIAPVQITFGESSENCHIVDMLGFRAIIGLGRMFEREAVRDACLVSVRQGNLVDGFVIDIASLAGTEYELSESRRMELDNAKVTEADTPTVVLLTQILDDHPKGVSLQKALREINYIRRTSRLKLASILSTNDCFAQKPGTGVWRYNPKRADAGNDIARRTYLKPGF